MEDSSGPISTDIEVIPYDAMCSFIEAERERIKTEPADDDWVAGYQACLNKIHSRLGVFSVKIPVNVLPPEDI